MTDRADLKCFHDNCLHGDEDGRRGKVLRTSRRKGRKVLSPQTERDTASSANIRFSGS